MWQFESKDVAEKSVRESPLSCFLACRQAFRDCRVPRAGT